MSPRAVITGRGAVSPAGLGVPATWRAARDGVSTVRAEDFLDLSELPMAPVSARLRARDLSLVLERHAERQRSQAESLLWEVIGQAITESGLDESASVRTVLLTAELPDSGFEKQIQGGMYGSDLRAAQPGLGFERGSQLRYYREHPPARRESVGSRLISDFIRRFSGDVQLRTLYATGTTGLRLVCEAARMIQMGRADRAVVAVGCQWVDAFSIVPFARSLVVSRWEGAPAGASRPFDTHRTGLVFGEASCAVVIENEATARARNAPCFARILGWSLSTNADHFMRPSYAHMLGVMRGALAHSELGSERVDVVDAMGSSTPIGDADEARAIHRVFGATLDRMRVTAEKAVFGYGGQAASLLETICCTCALAEGLAPPVPTCEAQEPGLELPIGRQAESRPIEVIVKNAFGLGGHYASMVMAHPNSEVGS